MKQIIQAFLDSRKLAIAGVSNKKENFGRSIMTELAKLDYIIYPVNPRCEEIDGILCVPSVNELPEEVQSLILAVPASLTDEIVEQCIGTPIKRVWMLKGVGKGAHKFHLWIRKTFGKLPAEYLN